MWDGYSVIGLHLAPLSYYATTLLLQTQILTPIMWRRRRDVRAAVHADAVPILTVALFSPLAYILFLTAMLEAPVALVACLWFREGHISRRLAGAAVVLAGIAAISL